MSQVPDLGSIEVSGPVGPARDATPDILGKIGESVGSAIKTGVAAGQVEGANIEFNALTDAALEAEPADDTQEMGPPVERSGSPEAITLNTIRTLQAGAEQSSGSRKLALESQLRSAVQDLGNKHPHMRQRYAQEFGQFMRTDPEYLALGMLDAADADFSASSAKELDRIKSHATGSITSGGLGMDPAQKFGTRVWVREYLYKQGNLDTINANKVQLDVFQSTEALTARDSAENFQQSMTGISNVVKGHIAQARDMTTRVGIALRDPTEPSASLTISEWNNWGKQAVVQDLQRGIFAIEEAFGAIPINEAHTDAYQAAKALKDDRVAALDLMVKGVTADSPTIMKAFEAYETMQLIAFEKKFPKFANDARNMIRIMPMIEYIDDTFGAEGALIRNEVGGFAQQGVEYVLGRMIGKTRIDDLPPNATPEQILDKARQVRTDSGNLYDTGQTDARGNQTNASQDLSLRSRDSFLSYAKEGTIAPHVASSQMAAAGADIDQMLTSGEASTDMLNQIIDDMSRPGYVDMAQVALTSAVPDTVKMAGEQLTNALFLYTPKRNASYLALRDTRLSDGVSMADVMWMDEKDIDTGQIRVMVDKVKLERLIREQNKRDFPNSVGTSEPLSLTRALRLAEETSVELSRTISRDLRAESHALAFTQGIAIPGYRASWAQGLFNKYFGNIDSDIVAIESQGSR